MNQLLVSIPVFFLMLFAYTRLAGPIPFTVSQTTTTKTDVFSVTGTGKSSAIPDIARVSVGIQTDGPTVKKCQETINTTINTVSEAIKKLGIDKKDIETANYSIHPKYDYANGKQTINGYSANTSLTVTIRDMEKANSVIDAATAAGANTVGGVSFSVEDTTKVENEARDKAIQEAKTKAENAAKIAGFKLGKIINYQENFNSPAPMRLYAAAAKEMDSAVGSTQVEPGSQEMTVSVTLSYELQ